MPKKKTAVSTAAAAATPTTSAASPSEMDPTTPERANPVQAVNRLRTAYGLQTLLDEMSALFPEVGTMLTHVDGRNTALGAVLDLSALSDEDAVRLRLTLESITYDERVSAITVDDKEKAGEVEFVSNPRTQDSREPFDLAAAFEILFAEEGPA